MAKALETRLRMGRPPPSKRLRTGDATFIDRELSCAWPASVVVPTKNSDSLAGLVAIHRMVDRAGEHGCSFRGSPMTDQPRLFTVQQINEIVAQEAAAALAAGEIHIDGDFAQSLGELVCVRHPEIVDWYRRQPENRGDAAAWIARFGSLKLWAEIKRPPDEHS